MNSQKPETPNHALQRTGSAVTAPAADHHRLSAHRQVPRPLRLSLSLGSLGGVRTHMIIVCPKAGIWWQTFERLRDAGIAAGHVGDAPPFPLILAGWIYSSDRDKQERWLALVRWAEEHSLSHLIPELAPEDQYCTDYLSTSYPEQHYRSDRYVRRDRPSADALDSAMLVLRRDWHSIAGGGLSAICEPTRFTGRKARRLLVTVTQEHQPPWGSWHALSYGPERKTFTEFRHRINQAIAPVYVDHIDFCLRVTHAA